MSSYAWERSEAGADTVVVALSGELDLTNAKELEQRLSSACDAEALLAVDLNDVFFVDSAALHVLFRLARARGKDRLVLLLDPGSGLTRTLSLVGLDRVVPVWASLDEGQRG